MEMVKIAGLLAGLSMSCAAADFAIAVGNPIAANMPAMKSAAFAVRLENCASETRAIEGTAEGIVNGERKSIELKFFVTQTPNAYVVGQTWPRAGTWVMAMRASCGDAKAGAIVPVNAQGIVRESSRFFSHAPTKAEIEATLGGSAEFACPVTRGPVFTPPSPFTRAHRGAMYFGTEALWTAVEPEWSALPHSKEGYRQKIAWWSMGYDWTREPQPALTITGRRLDAPATPLLQDDRANGSHSDVTGSFIMTGVNVPTEGCWEITGHYKGQDLKFVVLVKGGSQ